MTEFKIDDLSDNLLDFAVGVAEGVNPQWVMIMTGYKTIIAWDNDHGHRHGYRPSSDPRVGLPIADREHIDSGYCGKDANPDWVGMWWAELGEGIYNYAQGAKNCHSIGRTRLEAMMRCRLKISSPNKRTITMEIDS